MNGVIHEHLDTPVSHSCDVLICGGGFAGISAALSAARLGKRVILMEKQYVLGGLGTAGLITYYLPLCDGMGRQVSFGIAEELFRLSISLGAEDEYPANWLDSQDPSRRTEKDPRFRVRYNPNVFAMLAEKLLLENGVTILYGCYAVGTQVEGERITAVVTESISGRQAIQAEMVIDATGDACIAALSGTPTARHERGNILAAWYYGLGKQGYFLNPMGFSDVPSEETTHKDRSKPLADKRFWGLSCEEQSEMTILSHTSVLNDLAKRRGEDPCLVPTSIASIPQIRMNRRLCGAATLEERQMHCHFPDSIGMVSDWRKRGPVYEVPFGTLYSPWMKNLLCAGRCTSVTDDMWDIMRVIPCCAVTGQAAGTAAALCRDVTQLPVSVLQEQLSAQGVVLFEKDLV